MHNNYTLTVYSDKGTTRDNNEDNMFASFYDITNHKSEPHFECSDTGICNEGVSLIAVFDGMGGTEGGEIASNIAAQNMALLFARLSDISSFSDSALSEIFLDYKKKSENDFKNTLEDKQAEIPGSTCCGFIIHHSKLKPFWIGDSRLYLLRQGKLILLTKDDTIAQEKIDYGLISQDEAMTVRSWHYVTKYFGDMVNNFTFGEEFAIEPGDKFLLCTDGISDKFSPKSLATYLSEDSGQCVKDMDSEIQKYSDDNATAIIFEVMNNTEKEDDYVFTGAKRAYEAIGKSIRKMF